MMKKDRRLDITHVTKTNRINPIKETQ